MSIVLEVCVDMEVFLILNGHEIDAPMSEQENIILRVAAGKLGREAFAQWLQSHTVEFQIRERQMALCPFDGIDNE